MARYGHQKEEYLMSLINKEVSEFSVKAYQNHEFRTITKDNLLGQWSVFFFYPADFTFVCPTELEDLENHYDAFQKLGCEIYSVANPTHALARDFEVLIESAGLAERGTFIINPEGKIVAYEVNAGNVGRNADELLRKVQACQFVHAHGDEVCPAKWQPGAETLKPSLDLVGAL